MNNISIIYYTPNLKNEKFAERIREKLLETIGDTPLISVSQKPLKFGQNICVGEIGRSYRNVFKQMLAGVKEAKTDYVGMAEDDTLYPAIHYDEHFYPPLDTFAYNMSRWSICTWVKPPVYVITNRLCNSNMIAPRKLLIELIEKRMERFPEGKEPSALWSEPGKQDGKYGLGEYKIKQFMTTPIVSFIHPETLAYDFLGTRKRLNPIRAYSIPYWGEVKSLIDYYYEGN